MAIETSDLFVTRMLRHKSAELRASLVISSKPLPKIRAAWGLALRWRVAAKAVEASCGKWEV